MTFLTSGMTSTESVEWGTPRAHHFDPLHEIYDFTLDPAASHANALLPRYCTIEGTFERTTDELAGRRQLDERDGLNRSWAGERVFINPPWGEGEDPCPVPHSRCTKQRCERRGHHITERIHGLPDFLLKMRNEFVRNRTLIVAYLPARPDTAWFHDYVLPWARVRWLRGRVAYIDPTAEERIAKGLQPRTGPPVGTLVATYR